VPPADTSAGSSPSPSPSPSPDTVSGDRASLRFCEPSHGAIAANTYASRFTRTRMRRGRVTLQPGCKAPCPAAASGSARQATFHATIERGGAPSGAVPLGTAPDEWSQAHQCAYVLKATAALNIPPAARIGQGHPSLRSNCLRPLGWVTRAESAAARSGGCEAVALAR
jgi:hypothetical protein